MTDGIEQAARAFDAVIRSNPDRTTKSQVDQVPTEDMFGNLGNLEIDENSPEFGGGDGDVYEDEARQSNKRHSHERRRQRQRPSRNDETDAEHPDSEAALVDETDSAEGDGGTDADGEREHGDADADDADDESDADESEEEEENPEESAARQRFLEQKVDVTIDGEPAEVTVKEALEGYVRTETFHRRMNQLDEAKKIVRRAASDAVQNYEYAMNLAKQMHAHMDEMIPKEPDWDIEFQKDPVKARELQRYYEKANSFRAALNGQMQEAAQRQAQSSAAQLHAFAEEETSKFEQSNRKSWSDPKRKSKDLQSMRRTALALGFSEDELSQVYDSRMLQVLLKASKYDRMMAAKPKPDVRMTGKPIPPGTGSARQRTVQKGVSSAMKRLNRTGRVDDAAVVFDELLARG